MDATEKNLIGAKLERPCLKGLDSVLALKPTITVADNVRSGTILL
jgi:hypothetical protein